MVLRMVFFVDRPNKHNITRIRYQPGDKYLNGEVASVSLNHLGTSSVYRASRLFTALCLYAYFKISQIDSGIIDFVDKAKLSTTLSLGTSQYSNLDHTVR